VNTGDDGRTLTCPANTTMSRKPGACGRLNSLPLGSATFKEPMECLAALELPDRSGYTWGNVVDHISPICYPREGSKVLAGCGAEFAEFLNVDMKATDILGNKLVP